MNKFVKKNWFYILVGVFICANLMLFIYNNSKRNREAQSLAEQNLWQQALPSNTSENTEFYGAPCPEVIFSTIDEQRIDIRDLIGNVIIIRFSRFFKRDLPVLLYLEHLKGKFEDKGTSLIFINSLGKHNREAISKVCDFSSPIVEDDGTFSGLFNAGLEETIIVDRDFTIKFKYDNMLNLIFNKSIVHDEVLRRIFIEEKIQFPSYTELASIFNMLSFYDVLKRRERNIKKEINEKKTILTLITSVCTTCNEINRIQLLKELATKLEKETTQIILLFGIGNNIKTIKEVAQINGWHEFPITVGIIGNSDRIINDYYRLFQLDTDPRTFIYNRKGQIIFAEDINNSRLIDLNFLIKK